MIEPFPFHSALKFILQRRRVAIEDAVRRPLRTLSDDQRDALRTMMDDPAGEIAGILAGVAAVQLTRTTFTGYVGRLGS